MRLKLTFHHYQRRDTVVYRGLLHPKFLLSFWSSVSSRGHQMQQLNSGVQLLNQSLQPIQRATTRMVSAVYLEKDIRVEAL